ncbi:MAG TPA: hypothetical protein VJA40_00625 [archaeon]|nr:hypothetical protein [archaeon]
MPAGTPNRQRFQRTRNAFALARAKSRKAWVKTRAGARNLLDSGKLHYGSALSLAESAGVAAAKLESLPGGGATKTALSVALLGTASWAASRGSRKAEKYYFLDVAANPTDLKQLHKNYLVTLSKAINAKSVDHDEIRQPLMTWANIYQAVTPLETGVSRFSWRKLKDEEKKQHIAVALAHVFKKNPALLSQRDKDYYKSIGFSEDLFSPQKINALAQGDLFNSHVPQNLRQGLSSYHPSTPQEAVAYALMVGELVTRSARDEIFRRNVQRPPSRAITSPKVRSTLGTLRTIGNVITGRVQPKVAGSAMTLAILREAASHLSKSGKIAAAGAAFSDKSQLAEAQHVAMRRIERMVDTGVDSPEKAKRLQDFLGGWAMAFRREQALNSQKGSFDLREALTPEQARLFVDVGRQLDPNADRLYPGLMRDAESRAAEKNLTPGSMNAFIPREHLRELRKVDADHPLDRLNIATFIAVNASMLGDFSKLREQHKKQFRRLGL